MLARKLKRSLAVGSDIYLEIFMSQHQFQQIYDKGVIFYDQDLSVVIQPLQPLKTRALGGGKSCFSEDV